MQCGEGVTKFNLGKHFNLHFRFLALFQKVTFFGGNLKKSFVKISTTGGTGGGGGTGGR